jgi:peptidoglycan-N-acetylglucosamine deacetylase
MQRKVTLTFDNGPYAGATDRILDILGKRDVRATFFLVGQRLAEEETRALARRAQAEGHWIGHHTMRHIVPLGMSDDPDHAKKEIGEADAAVKEFAHPNKFFRPPGKAYLGPHLLSKSALDYCVANGHTVVTWNDIPRDGVEPRDAWVGRAMQSLRQNAWTVPVLHDHHLGVAMDNFSRFIDQALDEGVTFVQEFPDEVVPVWRGQVRHPVEQFVTTSTIAAQTA